MNKVVPPSAARIGVSERPVGHEPRRGLPRAIQCLLPMWGSKYLDQFVKFGLPTLLAPGNLPTLAKALPCEFVILTSAHDTEMLRQHSACRHLASICRLDIRPIDDLITGSNYSTTITLAFERAVREAGEAMLDTCFFFLVSDYIFADGALSSVLERMQAGASGVLAGNFQVIAEEAITTLEDMRGPMTVRFAAPPRQLMRWALNHLHPMSAANMVNFPLTHSARTNRLFWRVDQDTLIARCYLMHMICIRPETTKFSIGASCDYSFIPEMCPSGRVDVITDSDEYLAVEMQPRNHESDSLRMGSTDPKALADSLSEWTTARHRENANHTLIFHAAEIPSEINQVMATADAFIADIRHQLSPTPQPHRNHPYWIGAIAAYRLETGQRLTDADRNFLLTENRGGGLAGFLRRIYASLYGRQPDLHPWNLRWLDFRILADLQSKAVAANKSILVVSYDPVIFVRWFAQIDADNYRIFRNPRMLKCMREEYMPMVAKFDYSLGFFRESELAQAHEVLARIGPLMKAGGEILFVVFNPRTEGLRGFSQSIAYHGARLLNLGLSAVETRYIKASRLRFMLSGKLTQFARHAGRHPFLHFPIMLFFGLPGMLLNFLFNVIESREVTQMPDRQDIYSSVSMLFHVPENVSCLRLPDFTRSAEPSAAAPKHSVLPRRARTRGKPGSKR